MSTPLQTSKPSSAEIDCTEEIRFAVVMYGGVSLAIYINGVTQELFRIVRSTARDASGNQALLYGATDRTKKTADQLTGTERVYRKLSYLLSDGSLLEEYRQFLKNRSAEARDQKSGGASAEGGGSWQKLDKILAENERPINTRFVVDIMSGTSAGGINAIYLAKALANNQSIDQLKQLWINEGAISELINDKKSVKGLGLPNQSPPQSLLNSRRMYLKLLKSLRDMGPDQAQAARSPYVDEMDLFITTTDIEGQPVPIRLSDTVVYERRHRNVFHFQYSTEEAAGIGRNDFIARNDPFLAYAARCTSSFPFAFEPMRLCDIDEALDTFPDYRGQDYNRLKDQWTHFFSDYIDPGQEEDKVSYVKRSFGDGGYLDNKPFTYATGTLAHRHAPVLVDRKLIYVEPSPEHPEDEPVRDLKPDALQNVKAAVLDLPSYETIREDLQRVLNRNELINRVNRISTAIEEDLDQSKKIRPTLDEGEWKTLDLAGMVEKFGIYYLPYRRLRIASTTDELAKMVARIFKLDERSAEFCAIRLLVRAWREMVYPDYHTLPAQTDGTPKIEDPAGNEGEKESPLTANQFLIDFDFKYWFRRLVFIRKKIDQLYRMLQTLRSRKNGNGLNLSKLTDQQKGIVKQLRSQPFHPLNYEELTASEKKELLGVLAYLKCEVGEVYRNLKIAARKLEPATVTDSDARIKAFSTQVSGIKIGKNLIDFLLGMPGGSESYDSEYSKLDEDECVARAKTLLDEESTASERFKVRNLHEDFEGAATSLKLFLKEMVVDPTWNRCKALLKANKHLPEASRACAGRSFNSKHIDSVRDYLWYYFSKFDDFDQISFPILYGTDVGESDVVAIIRISPEDAVSLINERLERKNSADGKGRQKLAGNAFHHFGAFLDKTWRQNDIMWGRLDGAERLITALLPDIEDQDVRADLIKEAQKAILIEELPPENRRELCGLMSDALVRASAGEPIETAINKVLADMNDQSPIKTRLKKVMSSSLGDDELLKFMATGYEVNRTLDPESMMKVLSRSTQVIGRLFEDIAKHNSLDGKAFVWVARAGQILGGLVTVAVPNRVWNVLFFHWLSVLYLFEILLVVGGTALGRAETAKFGWTVLGITSAINIIVLLLRDRMRLRKGWAILLLSIFVLAILLFAGVGIDAVFDLGVKQRLLTLMASIESSLGWS